MKGLQHLELLKQNTHLYKIQQDRLTDLQNVQLKP